MSHNQRIYPDTVYVNGSPIPSVYFQGLDTAQFKSLNGDQGGTWNPAAPIQIGGAGLWLAPSLPWQLNAGSQVLCTAGTAPLVHGTNDWIVLLNGHAASTQFLITSCSEGVDASAGNTTAGVPRFNFSASAPHGVVVAYQPGGRLVVPLRVHDGATFASCAFYFAVGQAHAGVPLNLPMFRVFKVDTLGNVTYLSSSTTQAGWSGNGFVQFNPTPATGALWYNTGNVQNFTYTLDANVVVDLSKYTYYAEIADEQGTNALSGNFYLDVQAFFSPVPDLRPS